MDRKFSPRFPDPSSISTCNCNTLCLSPNERIQRAMDILQHGRLSLLTALIKVLDPSEKYFAMHRNRIYACPKDQSAGKLGKLLDTIHNDWMELDAIKQVTNKVYDEMDTIKDNLRLKVTSITPEFLAIWDITSTR